MTRGRPSPDAPLSRLGRYTSFQFFDYLGSSLWLLTVAIFLLRALDLSPLQVGLVMSSGLVMQVLLEVPSGVLTDAIGHSRVLVMGFATQLLYVASYPALYIAYQSWSLDPDVVVVAAVVLEWFLAAALSMQSGVIETWAQQPIVDQGSRWKAASPGRGLTEEQEREVSSWITTLETAAKRAIARGQLLGGLLAFCLLAAGSRATFGGRGEEWLGRFGEDAFLMLPWLFAVVIHGGVCVLVFRQVREPEPVSAARVDLRKRFRRLRGRLDDVRTAYLGKQGRILEIGLDFALTGEAGRRYRDAVLLNAMLFFGIFTVQVFWAPTMLELLDRQDRVPGGNYFLVACVWGLLAGAVLLGNSASSLRFPSGRFRSYMGLLGLFAVCFGALFVALSHPERSYAIPVAVAALVLAHAAEGRGRPLQSSTMGDLIPDRARSTLYSIDAWFRSIVSAFLFIILGVAGTWGTQWLWMAAAVVLVLFGALALTTLVLRSAEGARPVASPLKAWTVRLLVGGCVLGMGAGLFMVGNRPGLTLRGQFHSTDGADGAGLKQVTLTLDSRNPLSESSEAFPLLVETEAPYAKLAFMEPLLREERTRLLEYRWDSSERIGRYRFKAFVPSTMAFATHARDELPSTIRVEPAAALRDGADAADSGPAPAEGGTREVVDRLLGPLAGLRPDPDRRGAVVRSSQGFKVPMRWLGPADTVTVVGILGILVGMLYLLSITYVRQRRRETIFLTGLAALTRRIRALDWRAIRHVDRSPMKRLQDALAGGTLDDGEVCPSFDELLEGLQVGSYRLAVVSAGPWGRGSLRERFEVFGSGGGDAAVMGETFELSEELAPSLWEPRASRLLSPLRIDSPDSTIGDRFEKLPGPGTPMVVGMRGAGEATRGVVDGVLVCKARTADDFTEFERLELGRIAGLLQEPLAAMMVHLRVHHNEETLVATAFRRSAEELARIADERTHSTTIRTAFWGPRPDYHRWHIKEMHVLRVEQERMMLDPGYNPADGCRVGLGSLARFLEQYMIAALGLSLPGSLLSREHRSLVQLEEYTIERGSRLERALPKLYLWELLHNLVRNGLKAALPELKEGELRDDWADIVPAVSLRVRTDDVRGVLTIDVIDRGPGFARAVWSEKVEQGLGPLANAAERKGLWIAIQAARALGGVLCFQANADNGEVGHPRFEIPLAGKEGPR